MQQIARAVQEGGGSVVASEASATHLLVCRGDDGERRRRAQLGAGPC